jgi:hypothetical protein
MCTACRLRTNGSRVFCGIVCVFNFAHRPFTQRDKLTRVEPTHEREASSMFESTVAESARLLRPRDRWVPVPDETNGEHERGHCETKLSPLRMGTSRSLHAYLLQAGEAPQWSKLPHRTLPSCKTFLARAPCVEGLNLGMLLYKPWRRFPVALLQNTLHSSARWPSSIHPVQGAIRQERQALGTRARGAAWCCVVHSRQCTHKA